MENDFEGNNEECIEIKFDDGDDKDLDFISRMSDAFNGELDYENNI